MARPAAKHLRIRALAQSGERLFTPSGRRFDPSPPTIGNNRMVKKCCALDWFWYIHHCANVFIIGHQRNGGCLNRGQKVMSGVLLNILYRNDRTLGGGGGRRRASSHPQGPVRSVRGSASFRRKTRRTARASGKAGSRFTSTVKPSEANSPRCFLRRERERKRGVPFKYGRKYRYIGLSFQVSSSTLESVDADFFCVRISCFIFNFIGWDGCLFDVGGFSSGYVEQFEFIAATGTTPV